jgi:hypothetical protein
LAKTFHVKRFSVQQNETRTVLSQLIGPFSGAVEYSQDFDGITAHTVGYDVQGPGEYQFTSAGNPANAARGWLVCELIDGGCDSLDHSRGGVRVLASNVVGFLVKISERAAKPSYAHDASTLSSQRGLPFHLRSRLRQPA